MARRTNLPQTIPECHALIHELDDRIETLEQENAQLRGKVESLAAEVTDLKNEIAALKTQIKTLKRALFGSRRERYIEADNTASDPTSSANAAAPTVSTTTTAAQSSGSSPTASSDRVRHSIEPRGKRTSAGRKAREWDASLPREQVLHRVPDCDIPLDMRQNAKVCRFFRLVREELEIQRPAVKVIEHHEEVLRYTDPETGITRMVSACAPPTVLAGCFAGPQLLATLCTSRFADHLPYYREEDILARLDVTLPRSTQCRWMKKLATVLRPLVNRMRQRVRQSHVMGIDETPVAELTGESGKGTRTAYLYALHGDAANPYSCFEYAAQKSESNVRRILGNFHGTMQSDAYICYSLVADRPDSHIIPAGCWAHARRKFEPLVKDAPHPQAAWILKQIQRLYDIEERARDFSDSDRQNLRQQESKLIVDQIGEWLKIRSELETPKSPLRNGVNYLWNRWNLFTRFLEDGAIPLDNNRTEAQIKGPVMGKKAWLFFGNQAGGETAAVLYSLTMTCRRLKIDVEAYLKDVICRIGQLRESKLDVLLPDQWLAAHPDAVLEQRVKESHAAVTRKRQRRLARRADPPVAASTQP